MSKNELIELLKEVPDNFEIRVVNEDFMKTKEYDLVDVRMDKSSILALIEIEEF